MRGEKIYEYELDVVGVTDYGISLDEVLSGQVQVPAQGVPFDISFEGSASGRLTGSVRGVDYLRIRADGRIGLEVRATIETEAGTRIALSADGVAVPRSAEPIADFTENVTLTTPAEDFGWINTRQVWGLGTVNFATGKVHVEAYMQ